MHRAAKFPFVVVRQLAYQLLHVPHWNRVVADWLRNKIADYQISLRDELIRAVMPCSGGDV